MIGNEENIKCGWCNEDSTAEEWQKATFDACYTREQRRAFKRLDSEKYFKRDSKMYYICPKCGLWQRGCNLTLTRETESGTKKFGGKPVIKVLDGKTELERK